MFAEMSNLKKYLLFFLICILGYIIYTGSKCSLDCNYVQSEVKNIMILKEYGKMYLL